MNQETIQKSENPMREIFIEKIILSCGGKDKELQKYKQLLEIITKKKAQIITSSKRIPDFGVRPGLEVGTRVTLRGKEATSLLANLLAALDNILRKKQLAENHFSFGIKEYIEIPGLEYNRDIGIRGFNTTVVFARKGLRTKRKKRKSGHVPHKQNITEEEIIEFMKKNYKTEFN